MAPTRTGTTKAARLATIMARVERGTPTLRQNPEVNQLDALNDLLERFYAGDRRGTIQDRIAALFYLFLEAPTRSLKYSGGGKPGQRLDFIVDNEDVRQEVMLKLWDWLLSGHLKRSLPFREKGWFGVVFRHQAIDMNRKRRLASMEGIPEIASTGVKPTEEDISRAQSQKEYSGRAAAGEGAGTTYLRRWYGRRPDVVLALELGVSRENLRVRAHRADVKVTEDDGSRKVPEIRRDDLGNLAVPVVLPRKPPEARKEWFLRWYPVLTELELVALTGYQSWPRVRAAARRLGMPDKPPETFPLVRVGMEWVALVYPYLSTADMALDLAVPVPLVQEALRALGVQTGKPRKRPPTAREGDEG